MTRPRFNRSSFPPMPVAASAAALALCAATVLAGCATAPAQPLEPERTSEAPNAIDVVIQSRTLSVHFATGALSPRPGQVEALNTLLAAGDVGRGDKVTIQRGAGALAEARARALAAALSREGLAPVQAEVSATPDGELRLVIEHAVAQVRGCPNWTKPPGNDYANTLHGNFGCAAALDLAAMVADPRDLIEGRPLAPVVGDAAVLAMHRYRTGLPERPEATGPVYFQDWTTTQATAGPKPDAPPAPTQPAPSAAPAAGVPAAVGQAAASAVGQGSPPQ